MAKIVAAPEDTLKDFSLEPQLIQHSPAQEKGQRFADAVDAGEEVDPLSEEEQEALYAEVVQIDAAISTLTERKEAIKQIFRRLDYGTNVVHQEAQGKVQVGHNPIFNEARFTLAYPYDERKIEKVVEQNARGKDVVVEKEVYPNREMYKITPDRPAIKRILGDEAAKEFYDEGEKKITFK